VAAVGENDPDVPSNVEVTDCLFESNTASDRGGGFFSRRSEPSVLNCTIRDNTASDGGGVYFFDSAAATMGDVQICGNSTEQLGGNFVDLGGNVVTEVCDDCEADITGDGMVGVDDLLELIANFGPCSGCAADVDGDGVVGVDDVLIVLSAWGVCP
jgi:predicted outer membrane repeat protein